MEEIVQRTPCPAVVVLAFSLILVVVIPISSCGGGTVAPPPTAATQSFLQQFDTLWQTFDREYSYFVHKNIDWNALRATYRSRAERAATQGELVQIVEEMLAQLRDRHVWLVNPSGGTVRTFVPQHFINFDRNVWQQIVARGPFTQVNQSLGVGLLNGTIPYISIESWNSSLLTTAELDAAVDQFQNAPAIIIDVRINGGGTDLLAFDLAARFADRVRTVEFVQFRNGPAHTDFTTLQSRDLSPRGSFQFTRPVFVLVGRGCVSSNESFIAAMRELPHVTVVGDTTAGSTGNPGMFPLGGGWQYSVSRWIAYTAQLQIIEDMGIDPDVRIAASLTDSQNGRDPILEYAISQFP
jgi:hypothetical protein